MMDRVLFCLMALAFVSCGPPGFAEEPPAAGDKPAAPALATPQQAYEAFAKAHLDRNWTAALQCMTPQLQDHYAFESVFSFGMLGPDKYERLGLRNADDLKKFFKEESDSPAPDPKDQDASRKYVASLVKDKPGFYGLLQRLDADSPDRFDWKTPLRNVVVNKDRAQGVVTVYVISYEKKPGEPAVKHKTPYDKPVYFQKTKTGWLIDLPNAEEVKAIEEGTTEKKE